MTLKLTPRPPEWVLCMDRLRTARNGTIACPIRRMAVDLASCAGCHWLQDADQDRFMPWTCDGDAFPAAAPIERTFVERNVQQDGALIIELL
jgi:hypothetical protein